VLHGLCTRTEKKLELSPQVFFPIPRVRSAFVRILPRPEALADGPSLERVERVVRAAFSTRRKTLANALRGATLEPRLTPDALAAAFDATGIDARARAETLAPERFVELTRALDAHCVGSEGRAS